MKKLLAAICSVILILCSVNVASFAEEPSEGLENTISGDVNGDGSVTASDLAQLVSVLLGSKTQSPDSTEDLNKDGSINILDVIFMRSYMLEYHIPFCSKTELDIDSVNYGSFQDYSMGDYLKRINMVITSYDEMLSFIRSVSSDTLNAAELTEQYNEEFFEKYDIVICFYHCFKESKQVESAVAEDGKLTINVFDLNTEETPEGLDHFEVVFKKGLLEKHQIRTVELGTEAKSMPTDNFKIEAFDFNGVIDYYCKDMNSEQLDELLDSDLISQEDKKVIKEEYTPDFLKKNEVIAVSRSYKNSIVALYDENYLMMNFTQTYLINDVRNLIFVSVPKSLLGSRACYVRLIKEDPCVDKPVIYLYPQQETQISVNMNIKGEFTCVYPEFSEPGKNEWTVTAKPDGTLYTEDGSVYSYLFWEGRMDVRWDMSKGFVVKGSDTLAFLRKQLPLMGLTPKEYNDFIVYWLPRMQNNEYNYITFQTDCYTDNAVLNVTPEPDSVLRVFMAYEAVSSEKADYLQKTTSEPQFDKFVRDGFTVVEWGGTEI